MSGLRAYLDRAPPSIFALYAGFAAFACYFSMYAYRKAFAAGSYAGPGLGTIDLKSLFLIAQVLGYATSKFLGIKVVSELDPRRRAAAIVLLIAASELALVLFALVPPPYSALCMVMNGLPLGMIWGLVFGFLEGRKLSDVLGAALCASFIVASGFVKSVGRVAMDAGVPEVWMPAFVGAIFFPPLLLFTGMLAQIPPPTRADEEARTRRAPMDRAARKAFMAAHAPGLAALVLAYVLLTAYRDFRDNFARELWDALGYSGAPEILTTAEIPVAIGALVAVAAVGLVKKNRDALLLLHALMIGGALLVGGSTLAFDAGLIGAAPWMISVGLGLYVGYVPFNSVLFDRLIAALGSIATAGFLITLADAYGYVGSVALLLAKSLARPDLSWLEFFRSISYAGSLLAIALFAFSALYFARRTR